MPSDVCFYGKTGRIADAPRYRLVTQSRRLASQIPNIPFAKLFLRGFHHIGEKYGKASN